MKAEKDFMGVRQSQNLTTELKRAQTEKTVNVPGQRKPIESAYKENKVSTEVPEKFRGKKITSWCTTSIPLSEFSYCLSSPLAWG